MSLNFDFLAHYSSYIIQGMYMTIKLTVASVLIGVILGLVVALMRMSRFWPFKAVALSYIEVIRGTPALVQLFIIYYGLPQLIGFNIPDYVAAIAALAINAGAYVAEIIRSGIQAVDRGQMEAARSLGMPHFLAMRLIILPQAIRNILPALANEFITELKTSSLVSVIGLNDLMRRSDIIRSETYRPFEPLLVVGALYFLMTLTLSQLIAVVERRMSAGD